MAVFDNVLELVANIKTSLNLSDQEVALLTTPRKISSTELEVDGIKYPAWRILFNNDLGPGKGGIRFHPEASEDEVKSLSFWMSIKNALLQLPFGGGKGGVRFDPKKASPELIDKISRAYIQAFHENLGQDIDVPAPDVYTNAQIMGVMLDEFEKIKAYKESAMITGKPLILGGLKLRGTATAAGGYLLLQEAAKKYFSGKTNLTMAVQGFGNAGRHMAEMAAAGGYKLVATSDSRGAIYQAEGLDINELKKIKDNHGSVADYSAGEKIKPEEILNLEVDVLVLAALENQITETNANSVKAKLIIELANGPIDRAGDKIIEERGIPVVPDVLANAGGVVVSYFEWCHNRSGNILDEDYLKQLLDKRMLDAWSRVISEQALGNFSLRTAAYRLAINSLLSAARSRGRI